MEKIFAVVKVLEDKKVNIGTFYRSEKLIYGGIPYKTNVKGLSSLVGNF